MKSKKPKLSINKWEERFYAPTIQWAYAASNTGGRAITVSNKSGKFQLHAHNFETGYDRQITRKQSGALFGSISPAGKYIYYLSDITGDEYGHFVRVPFSGGTAIDMTPEMPPYFSYTLGINDNGNAFCFTAAFAEENKTYFFSENTSPVCIYSSNRSISEPIISSDGNYTCIAVSNEKKDGWSECIIVNNKTQKIYARRLFQGEVTPLAFSNNENNLAVCILSNESGHRRPVFWKCAETKTITIRSTQFQGDIFVLAWDKKNENLLVCDVSEAHHRLFMYNISLKMARQVGPKSGSFDLFFGSAVLQKDGSFIVRWSDFNTPSQYIKIRAPRYMQWSETHTPNRQTTTAYSIKSVWFRSSDKNRVQAWIVYPKNTKKPIPFVIDIHGGPHGVVGNEYSPEIHAWLESGFGYCAVNYRGSIGFGKKFEEKIYGNPGYWEVEDIVAARNYLVRKKIADSSHIVITGWSWGGYATLLALGKYPSLWTAGIAAASIADFIMQYEDEPAYFKAIDEQRFKGTPKTAKGRYIRSSPMAYLHNIQSPVLVLHGKNDVRCPPRQIEHFARLMHKAKKLIKVVWYSSGHTGNYTNIPLRIQLLKKAIAFATTYINKKSPKKISREKGEKGRSA